MDEDQATPEVEIPEAGFSEDQAAEVLFERMTGKADADPEPAQEQEPEAQPEQQEQGDAQADEATAQEPEPEQGAQVEELQIEFAGKRYDVPKGTPEPLARAVQELGKNLYADYNKRSMELADVRKSADADRQRAASALQATNEMIDVMAELKYVNSKVQQYSQIDWGAAFDEDPVGAAKANALFGQEQAKQQALYGLLNQKNQERLQAEAATRQEVLQRAEAEIKRRIKDWTPQTAPKVIEYAIKSGATQEDLEYAQRSPAIVEMAWKALNYDALLAKKPEVNKRLVEAPKPPVKPNASVASQSSNRVRADAAMARLKKTGSVDSAADALLARMQIGSK